MNGYTSPSCEGSGKGGNTSLTGAVLRSATIKVYPEGIVRTDTESAYFCANGEIATLFLLASGQKSLIYVKVFFFCCSGRLGAAIICTAFAL